MTKPGRLASGEQYEISGGGYTATVVEVGGGLRTLSYQGRDLVDGYPADQMSPYVRGGVLMPWPGRIEDGSYRFGGHEYQLAITEPPTSTAIHGLVLWVPWQPVEHTESAVTLHWALTAQQGYPFLLDLQVRYEVSTEGLTVTFVAANVGSDSAPYACGPHPYLRAGDGPIGDWQLHVPAGTVMEMSDRNLPVAPHPVSGPYDFRSPRALGDTVLDNTYTDLARGDDGVFRAQLIADGPDGPGGPGGRQGVEVWSDEGFGWLQVYTSDTQPEPYYRRSVAIEPLTCPPNAFRSGDGLVVLEPGQEHVGRWGLRAL